MKKTEQLEVLRDVAGVLAEELRKSHPQYLEAELKGMGSMADAAISLLRSQHERDIIAVITALTTCGVALPVTKFIELCRDPVEHILEPRSK